MLLLFHREFNWRRPASALSFHAKPSDAPRSTVHDFAEAAMAAGAATRVKRQITTTPRCGSHPKGTTT